MDESRERLPERVWNLLEGDGHCFYSAASAWEVAIKRASGMLKIAAPLSKAAKQFGLTGLAITVGHGEAAGELPPHHRDPVDRLPVAQARMEALVLVTIDTLLWQYDVTLLVI